MESETRTTAPTKQQLLQARRRRRVVKFEENPPARVYNANMSAADGAAQPAPPTPPAAGPGPGSTNHMISFELGGGWQVKLSNCTAPLTCPSKRSNSHQMLRHPIPCQGLPAWSLVGLLWRSCQGLHARSLVDSPRNSTCLKLRKDRNQDLKGPGVLKGS